MNPIFIFEALRLLVVNKIGIPTESSNLSLSILLRFQFNLVVSDRIALNRSLPDIRKHQCRTKTYLRM